MTDLITRQAAIDVLDRNHILGQGLLNDTLDHIADAIMALPSAQPETHDKRTETHACDLIDRQAAIEAMEDVDWYHINSNGQLVHGANSKEDEPLYKAEDVHKVLNDVPSAQSERQKGEWIDCTEDGYVECPFCHSATNCDGNKDELHFCFSCGADMREDGASNADVES